MWASSPKLDPLIGNWYDYYLWALNVPSIPDSDAEDLTDRETLLLQLLREREECIQQLEDEIARLKGEKGKPKIKPSRLEAKEKALTEQPNSQDNPSSEDKEEKKRPGSEKRRKTAQLTIHETKVIQPAEEIPPGSE